MAQAARSGRVNGKRYTARHEMQPQASARAAGLRYVSDSTPGVRRRGQPPAFRYVSPEGRALRDPAALARIRRLAIPPAWTDVWICPREDGHIQATGRDARGRKQYRYHLRWREVRDETKYGRMLDFARALPRIHRRVGRDLALPGLPRAKALATIVRLLEATRIRVGNQEYARDNESFGLTTLRGRQVRVRGGTLRFRFRGKSGVRHDVELSDRQIARIVARMQDLPGEELFGYVDENGEPHTLESADVNLYIKDVSGGDFTSKDFRTWAGTMQAAEALARMPAAGSAAEARRNVVRAVDAVAAKLGNTKAVCRKCYIHPAVIDNYLAGALAQAMGGHCGAKGVVALLQAQLARDAAQARASGADGRSLATVLKRSLAISRRRRSRPRSSPPKLSSRPQRRSSSPRAAAPSPGAA